MKVKELRELLNYKDSKYMVDAFVEVYKMLPKVKKEEADVMITSILEGKGKAKKEEVIDYPKLFEQIQYFLDCAYAGYYFIPNKVIPKPMRSKWRFQVKQFINQLLVLPSLHEHYQKATNYLMELYNMLSYGCGVYIFSSEDPFRSVGIKQEELFEHVINHMCQLPIDKEKMKKMILCATNITLSSECLDIYLMNVLYQHFQSPNKQKIIVDICTQIVVEQEEKLNKLKKYDNRRYFIEKSIENLATLILIFSLSSGLTKKGLDYYFKHINNSKNEIACRALDIVDSYDDFDAWIFIYEYGLKKKINFSQNTKNKYEELMNNNV